MSFANLKLNKKLGLAFSTIIIAVGAMGGATWHALLDIETATGWDIHTTEVLNVADDALGAMVDQETGVRGYIISADEAFLDPFKAGGLAFETLAQQLASLTSDNPAQQTRIAALKANAAEWRSKVADVEIKMVADPATRDAAARMEASGAGKKNMDAIRKTLAEISTAEETLLATRRAAMTSSFATGFMALGIGSTITLLLSLSMGWLLSRAVAGPIVAMTAAMKRLASGDKSITVPAAGQLDELGAMAAAVETFKQAAIEKERLENMTAEERRAAEAARLAGERQATAAARDAFVTAIRPSFERLSAGDLTARLDPAQNRDYVEVCELFNDSVRQLETTIGSVVGAVSTMRVGLNEIAVAAGDLSQRTEQQAASLEETVAALADVTRGVNGTAGEAMKARNTATLALKNAEKGGTIVTEAVDAMSQIEQSSNKIGSIIGVIDEIAFQTNLLALNAGVEAARAGEAGRGFAVVAQEVRGLAQRSAEAAKEIKTLIATSSAQVEHGVALVTASGQSLQEIVAQVAEMNEVVSGIARSANEQSLSLKEVSMAADNMDKVTQQNAAMVEETTAAAQTLLGETDDLALLIERFRTGQTGPSGARPARPAAPARKASPAPSRPVAQMRTTGTGGAARKAALAPATDSWEEF